MFLATRVIINCTEIQADNVTSIMLNSRLYSLYKLNAGLDLI